MDTALIAAIDALHYFAVLAFGLIAGSFLNVVIYRVPRHESIMFPGSRCPGCGHELAFRDNIPLLSYLIQRGKCRYCGARVSPQYPIVEALAGALVLTARLVYGWTPEFFLAAFFLLVLLAISVIDIQHQIIPNVIVLPAMAVGAAAIGGLVLTRSVETILVEPAALLNPVLGFLIGGGLLFLLALAWPNGMGGGDVKLAALMGIFLGRYVIIALFFGFLLGSIGGVVGMTVFKKGRRDLIPFGPYLAAGSVFTLFAGVPIATWYLGLVFG